MKFNVTRTVIEAFASTGALEPKPRKMPTATQRIGAGHNGDHRVEVAVGQQGHVFGKKPSSRIGQKFSEERSRNFVSKEISHLMHGHASKGPLKDKHVPQRQAVAIALNVARRKGIKVTESNSTLADRILGEAKAKLGSGKRFAKLEKSIAAKGKVKNAAAVAAAIGRKKFGKKLFQNLASRGRACYSENLNSAIGNFLSEAKIKAKKHYYRGWKESNFQTKNTGGPAYGESDFQTPASAYEDIKNLSNSLVELRKAVTGK